jgi:hypothetical protein
MEPLRKPMIFINVKYDYIGHSAHNNVENVIEYWKSGKPQQPFAVICNYVEIFKHSTNDYTQSGSCYE